MGESPLIKYMVAQCATHFPLACEAIQVGLTTRARAIMSRGSMEVIDPEYPDKNRLLSPSSFNYALYALVVTTFLR